MVDRNIVRQQILELERENFVYYPSNYNSLIFINYILHKHKQQLLLPTRRVKLNVASDLFMHWFCDDQVMLRKLAVPPFYDSMVKAALRNNDIRFVAFPLVLHHKNNCKDRQTRGWNHMTLVLYDKKYKYIELFDPANSPSNNYNMEILPMILFNVLQNQFNIQINGIVTPSNICIGGGIQALQEEEVYSNKVKEIIGGNIGFCSIFSVLYLDFRLANPDKRPSQVVELIKKTANDKVYSLTKYIVEYLTELQSKQREIENSIDSDILEKIKVIEAYPDTNSTSLSNRDKIKVVQQLLKILSAKLM